MHEHERRILAPLSPVLSVAALIAGLSAGSSPLAQEAGRAIGREPVKRPSAAARTPASPADKAVRKAAQSPESAIPPRPKVDPRAAKAMNDLLKKWEEKSATIKTLTVKYKRKDVSELFENVTNYEGEARLTSDNRAYLDFWEIVEGKAKPVFFERIVCDGKNVYQFKGPERQVFIFPLPADRKEKILQQGPLPFLFNMRAAEAKQRYEMALVAEDAKSYTIQIIPLLPIDREEYSQALLKLGKNEDPARDLLPQAIRLTLPNGKDTKTFTFAPEGMIPNKPIGSNWFDGAKMTAERARQKWTVLHNPGADGRPRPASPALGARPVRDPSGRPAMKAQAGAVRQK